SPRSRGGVAAHFGSAADAEVTAASASSTVAFATDVIRCSFDGSNTSIRVPDDDGRHAPAMYRSAFSCAASIRLEAGTVSTLISSRILRDAARRLRHRKRCPLSRL